jgi:diguanylate cyclase (GGDEF)-like protein
MVCRLGGDEFVIILTTLHSKLTAKQVADNILALISQAFFIQEKTVKVGVSIGIAIYPKDHNEADLLMKLADDAMFQAKMQGKNCYVFASNIAEQIDGSTKN